MLERLVARIPSFPRFPRFPRLAAALCGIVLAGPALAQEAYPSRPIKLVVGFGTGGVTDVLGRLIAAEMQKSFGQPVIVENRAGASGIIGTEYVAKSAPDGYTLLVLPGTHTINAALRAKLPYDSIGDFTPITLVASAPNLLVVKSDSPIRNLADYLAAAKAKPGELSYGSSGIGTTVHIAGELLAHLAGVKFNHIPYKASNQSVEAVVGGQIASSWSAVNAALPHIKSGRARPIAVASAKRSSFVPEVPTFVELGVNGMTSDTWIGLAGPGNLPASVAAKLNAEVQRQIALPEMRERILNLGAEPVGTALDQFGALMRAEIASFANIVRTAGIKPE